MSAELLEAAIDATDNPVVGENHDLGTIGGYTAETVRAEKQATIDRIRSGRWDAAEYGITGAEQAARLGAAITDEDVAKELSALRERAIRRADLDVTNGRVNVMVNVGEDMAKMPWTRVGTFVRHAVNSAQALQYSGADFTVSKVPAAYQWNGMNFTSDETFLLIRDDTGAELSHCGVGYEPIQAREGTAFLDEVMGDFGARYETAGVIRGGRTVWFQILMPEQAFEVQRGDTVHPFVMLTLFHKVGFANKLLPCTHRAVCANTHRQALNSGVGKGISIPHTGDVKGKVKAAREALGLAVRGFEDFAEQADAMVRAPLALRPYANEVLDAVLDVTEADCAKGADLLARAVAKTQAEFDLKRKAFERQILRRGAILEEILELGATDRTKPHDTAWGSYNTMSEWADHHERRGPKAGREERRFEDVLVGQADDMKQAAWSVALEATR